MKRNGGKMERKLKLVSKAPAVDSPVIFEERPWGNFKVLEEGAEYKVKRIEVFPLRRLSYQKHKFRAEHWYIVQGTAKVTLEDRISVVKAGESVDIAVGDSHRVENPEAAKTLIFIEVQRGGYLGEDDIIRLSDDFGRVAPA